MGLHDCQIIFDNPTRTYYPGQNVTGRALFIFNSPKTVNAILIRFKGEACTHWTESESTTDSDGRSTTRTVSYGATEEYFNVTHYLVKRTNETKVILNVGHHSFPFTFTLPQKLPSSFESDYGKIRYTVKVILDRPWKFNQDMKVAFSVVSVVDLNLYPDIKTPKTRGFQKTFCCCFCTSGRLTITANLPYTGFVPGQPIPLQLKCNNLSNVDIGNIQLKLQEVVTYHSKGKRTKVVRNTIAECCAGLVDANDSKTFYKNIIVPALPPSNLDDCNIIDLKYEIKIKIHVPGFHRNAKMIFPVIIGTVPLVSPLPELQLTLPSAPPLQNDDNASTPESPPPPYSTSYPNLPPPSYEESIRMKTTSIKDESDTTYTRCEPHFSPRYPVFTYMPHESSPFRT